MNAPVDRRTSLTGLSDAVREVRILKVAEASEQKLIGGLVGMAKARIAEVAQ
jgi:hypothetical protein